MKSKFTKLLFFLILACGDNNSDSSNPPPIVDGLAESTTTYGQVIRGGVPMGWAFQNSEGFSALGLQSGQYSGYTDVFAQLPDSRLIQIAMNRNGMPESLMAEDGSVIQFKNFQNQSYDAVFIAANGEQTIFRKLDYSQQVDPSYLLSDSKSVDRPPGGSSDVENDLDNALEGAEIEDGGDDSGEFDDSENKVESEENEENEENEEVVTIDLTLSSAGIKQLGRLLSAAPGGNIDKFVGALTIALRLAACPISLAASGGTLGGALALAVATCSYASKTFADVVSNKKEINLTDQAPRWVIDHLCDPELLKDRSEDNLTPCLKLLFADKKLAAEIKSKIKEQRTGVTELVYQGTILMQNLTVNGNPVGVPTNSPSPFGIIINYIGSGYSIDQRYIDSLEGLSAQGQLQHINTQTSQIGEFRYLVRVEFALIASSTGGTLNFEQSFELSEDLETVSGYLTQTTTIPDPEDGTSRITVIRYTYSGQRQY